MIVLIKDRPTRMKKAHGPASFRKRTLPFAAKRRASAPEPDPQLLAEIFRQCGIELSAPQIERFWTYHDLLRSHNAELNLTRIHNFSQMVLKLYVDSVLPGRLIELPSPLMDLGSGPGMPGIPLKIMHPDKTVYLAEGRGPRVAFLNEVITRMGLTEVSVIGRAITPAFDRPVAGVITRAVETIAATLERVQGCLAQQGRMIFMKGPGCEPEIAQAVQRWRERFRLVEDIPYRIGRTANERRLVVFERLDEPMRDQVARAGRRHRVTLITSAHNERFTEMKKLLNGRGVKKASQALISGARPVADLMALHPNHCLGWITPGTQFPPPTDGPSQMEWFQLDPALFEVLDQFGTHGPLLWVRFSPPEPWLPSEGFGPGCSLLVPFQDPENVGAVIRSAAAFGVSQVIFLAESAHPYHPKAVRASVGSMASVRLRQGPALANLPPDLPIIALSAQGRSIDRCEFGPSFGLLAGMEGPGLPDIWRQQAVCIPIQPVVESLNAAVATAVALYEWSRRK